MNAGMEFAHKFARAYAAACKPLCRELKLPQTRKQDDSFSAATCARQKTPCAE